MLSFGAKSYWLGCVLAACVSVGIARQDQAGRQLNPYHEKQLQDQIQKCASGVLACTDAEQRCVKQQELCQLLVRSERYDEALQVAHNVYQTNEAGAERRAAHHYLVAEIYNLKMQASSNVSDMEKNRQSALAAAQDVLGKKYSSKWGVSEAARNLVHDLSNSNYMAKVKQRVVSRQGQTGDSAKEAIADAQRRYLDATQGGGATATARPASGSSFTRKSAEPETSRKVASQSVPGNQTARVESLPSSPSVKRTLSPERYQTGETMHIGRRLQSTGLLTSQPGGNAAATVPSDAKGASTDAAVDSIAERNLATLLEAAKKRREAERKSSPYATGQQPSSNR